MEREMELRCLKNKKLRIWVGYHSYGRTLTEEEYSIITEYDSIMNQLIPTKELLEIGGSLDNLMHMDLKILAEKFGVMEDVICIKINYLIGRRNTRMQKLREENKVKKKILKEEGNIIFADFNKNCK